MLKSVVFLALLSLIATLLHRFGVPVTRANIDRVAFGLFGFVAFAVLGYMAGQAVFA